MLKAEPIINVDLDGVVYPWHEVFKEWAEHQLDRELPPITHWNFYEDWNLSQGGFKNLFRRGVEYGNIWDKLVSPVEGAIEHLWDLSDDGYYIRIVTHRLAHKFGHKLAVDQTVAWLDRYSIPYRSLVVIGPEPKTNYPADVMVDDSPSNLWQWEQKYPGTAIRFERPWNRGAHGKQALEWYDVNQLIRSMT